MLVDGTVRGFLDGLGSASAVPGGGAASAMAAAMAARLFSMTVNMTMAREEERREALAGVATRLRLLGDQLTELVDRDARAFHRVGTAYAMAEDAEDQRIQRAMEIQLATREATEVPLEVVQRCVELFENGVEVVAVGRASCISDAGVGNLLALSAAMGALLNVSVNLQNIDDDEFVSLAQSKAADLGERCQAGFEAVREAVGLRLSGAQAAATEEKE